MKTDLRFECEKFVPGNRPLPAGEEFALIADWCRENNFRADFYGNGDLIAAFERKVAELLGFAAGCFMPSGTMAQQIALKIYSAKTGNARFAIHPTSHLELHENHAYHHLSNLSSVMIGDKDRPLTALDIANCPLPVSTVIVELPAREIGGQLPSWEELKSIKEIAEIRNIYLHLDGARLWETKNFYRRNYDEICRGFDSVYVSFYKGIGALTGAMLLGSNEFISEARIWLRRYGGNLFQMHPFVASAARRFDRALALMPELMQRTREAYQTLKIIPAISFRPAPPQVNLFHLYFESTPEKLSAARDQIAETDKIWVANNFTSADGENTSYTEIYVGEGLLEIRNSELFSVFSKLSELSK